MAEDKKFIRDMDRVLLRVPDGMRDRLAARALANHRSMNAEAVSILAAALDDPSGADLQSLKLEAIRLDGEIQAIFEDVTLLRERRRAVRDAIDAASQQRDRHPPPTPAQLPDDLAPKR